MTDFLLELRSEEIPARMQDDARQNLVRLFVAELDKAGLKADDIATYATPRRLALIAYGLPLETQAVLEEIKGPKTSAPPQALDGFLRKTGLTQDQLVERDGVYFAVINKLGRATADVLAEAIPAIIRAFAWPKSMRWGGASASTESLRWVRPLHGIVALLGDDVVPCEVDGIASGRETIGHRFHHSGPITIGNAADYDVKLRAAHVIVDQEERQLRIREGAIRVAQEAGLELVQDPSLFDENAGLTEWPVVMLGRFDPAFLAVPPEVIQLTARVNQKYFICRTPLPLAGGAGGGSSDSEAVNPALPTPNPSRKREGDLAPAFVCTANIVASDGGAAIIAGNEKVLAARLSDAKFFWEQDLKIPLADQAKKLSNIVFHEKLGTVADKVERVAKLARWLVEEGIVKSSPRHAELGSASTDGPWTLNQVQGDEVGARVSLADMAETAARLCKADLVSGMVGEFPELQGIMGGYYARAQGLPDAVADAIRDHYKPVGQGDDVPTAPVTVAVSLADKLDTIAQFFAIWERPTGSKDPFAIRRAALSALSILIHSDIRLPMKRALAENVLVRVIESRGAPMGDAVLAVKSATRDITFKDDITDFTSILLNKMKISLLDDHEDILRTVKFEVRDIVDFFADRLKVQQREAGVRHDLIDAVFALGGEDDLVRLLARVKALQAFVGTADGVNLLAGYKRAANLLKQAGATSPLPHAGGAGGGPAKAPPSNPPTPSPSRMREGDSVAPDADAALLAALDAAEPTAATAIEAEDFTSAMAALASLRAPIDAFFDGVMVNDPDADVRAFRLGLLTRFRDAVHRVADFSKIEG